MSYLVRHNSTWHFRYRTGNVCLKLSLDTGNLRRAERLSQKLHRFMAKEMENTMDADKLRRALAQYRDTLLKIDQERRWMDFHPYLNISDRHFGQEEPYDEILHGELKLAIQSKNFRFMSGLDSRFLKITGYDINTMTDAEQNMVRYHVAVELLKVMDLQQLRMQGHYSLESVILHSINSADKFSQPAESTALISMRDAITSWETFLLEERKSHSTLSKYLLCAREFLEINGNIDVCDITPAHCRAYREALKKLPARYRQRFKNKTIAELLTMEHPSNTLCDSVSINDKLNAMKQFMAWAVDEGHAMINHMNTVRVKSAKRTKAAYVAYTMSDIKNIFNQDYLSLTSGKAWQFWIPLLALFTGARQGELDQLKVEDVIQIDDVWCIKVQVDPDDAKSSRKTEAAERIVPLHPFLVETLRFPEYAMNRKSKDKRIFDSTVAKSGYGKNVSKWFNQTFLPKIPLESAPAGKRKAFHSFRSTVCTVLKHAHADSRMASQVVGHVPADVGLGWTNESSMTYDYYASEFPARMLYDEVIMKIQYEISLDHLSSSPWIPQIIPDVNSNR